MKSRAMNSIKQSITSLLSLVLFAGLFTALPIAPAKATACSSLGYSATIQYQGGTVEGLGKKKSKTISDCGGYFAITIPNRANYVFAGWLDDTNANAGGKEYDNLNSTTTSWAPNADQLDPDLGYGTSFTLFAQWTPLSYAVTYDFVGATGGNSAALPAQASGNQFLVGSVINGSVLNLPTPTKAGYTFSGWSYSGTTYAVGQQFTMPSNAVTFTANWTAITYNITFDGNGFGTGSIPSPLTYTAGNAATAIGTTYNPGNLQRANYTFAGWGATPDTTTAVTTYNSFSNATLYAIWSGSRYTISFSLGSGATGTVPASQTNKTVGSIITLPGAGNLAKTGYSFVGWSDGAISYAAGSAYTVPSSSKQLTAVWVANVYTVTYDVNGANWSISYSSQNFTVGSSAISLPIPTLTSGFPGVVEFDSWVDPNGNHLGTTFTPTSSVTLWANWNWLTHTFTWNANGGSTPVASSTWKTNESWITAPIASRAGYTQTGWYSAASGGNWETNGGLSYRNWASKTLYAHWTPNIYPLQFVSWDRSTYLKYTVGSSEIVLSTPTRLGYRFDGWFTSAAGGTKIGSGPSGTSFTPTFLNCNITYGPCPQQQFFAHWTANTYAISYDANGALFGNVPADQGWTFGGSATILSGNTGTPALAKPFNTFGGWSATSGGTSRVTTYSTGADKTFFAIWTPVSNKVTYNSNGSGSSVSPASATSTGGSLLTLPLPTRTGYTFSGWYDAASGGNSIGSDGGTYQPSAAVTLYAHWTKN